MQVVAGISWRAPSGPGCSHWGRTTGSTCGGGERATTKSQGGMAAFLRTYTDATRVVVGGSAAGAVTVEDFLLGNVALPWS